MYARAFVRASRWFAVFLAICIAVLGAWALLDHGSYQSLWEAFKDRLFIGGLIIALFGGLIGGGFSQSALYRSSLYRLSGNYQNTIHEERMERRRQEFAFMILCVVTGVVLVILPYTLP
jgi:hypothetical protein